MILRVDVFHAIVCRYCFSLFRRKRVLRRVEEVVVGGKGCRELSGRWFDIKFFCFCFFILVQVSQSDGSKPRRIQVYVSSWQVHDG